MLSMHCPLNAPEPNGKPNLCRIDCAWLMAEGDGKPRHCAITCLPRLTAAIEAQTSILKDVAARGFPGPPQQES